MRQFLGLTSYYRRFVKGYSEIARSIYDMIKANAKWNWDANCEAAFLTLKEKLTTAPVLAYPDENGGEFMLVILESVQCYRNYRTELKE